MNKISKILLLLLLVICVGLSAVACAGTGDDEIVYDNIETITVNEGSIENGFLINDFNINKILLDIKYKDSLDEKGHEVKGETVQIPANMNMVRAEDKVQLSVPGSKTIILIYGQYEISFILKLYAEEITKYDVSFLDVDGNILGDIQRVIKGGTAQEGIYPIIENYDFIGWTDRDTNMISSYNNIIKNTILIATYEPKAYVVKYFTVVENKIQDSDSAVGGDDSTPSTVRTEISTVNVPRGKSALTYAPEIPVMPGYSNGRWENEEGMAIINGSVLEFNAIYDQDTVVVTFNYKKNNDEPVDETKNYYIGDEITQAFDAESKSGKFKFVGWYTKQVDLMNPGSSTIIYKNVSFPYIINSEMTFVAEYINVAEGNVSFTTNDGGDTYIVNGFNNDTDVVVIPNTYNSKPVVGITPSETLFAKKQISEFVVSTENQYFKVEDGVLYNFDKTTLLAYPNTSTLKNIILPSTVENIEKYAFYNANNLHNITFDSKLKNIGKYAFANCGNLLKLELPDSLLVINDYAFSMNNGSLISEITFIGDSKLTSIGYKAFDGLEQLTEFDLPATVTYLGSGAFINCVNLDSIAVSNNNANFVVDENDGILYNIDKTILYLCPANNCVNNKTDIILPITLEKVMEGAFSYSRLQGICFTSPNVELESYSINTPYLSAVRILCSSSFTYAGSVDPTNLGNIFGEFIPSNFYVTSTDIKNNIQNYYTDSTVTEYDSEDWLGLVDYENNFIYSLQNRIDVNGVTITEVVILGARSTSSIMDIPSTLTLENYSVVKIAANAFAYDKNITRITLPSAIVEIEKCAFENMPNLTSITLDDNLTIIGDRAFYGSNKLATISFSENMNLESVGDKAFEDTAWYDNDSQVMITINDWLIKYHGYGVTANIPSNIKYIASEAFINKTNLTSIDFGNLSEAKLINIENNAFQSCKSLVQITLPATLVRVGDDAFMDCDKLILVTIQINKSDLGNIEFGNNAVPNSNIIHCFEGEEISYKLIYHVDENTDSVKGVVFVEPEYIEDNANRRFAGWYDESSYTNLTIFPLTLSDDNTTEGDNIRVKNIYAKFNSIENNNGGSIDLKFKLNDKNTYTVQEYVGNEKYVVIPKKYKGKNVTAIAENTFKDKDFIENISLPYSIEQSTGAKISDITYIGKDAFTGTAWYENILGDYIIVHDVLIRYKGEAHLVEIPANISSIADGAFYDNDFIEKVVIPVGVTEIGEYTFFDCNNLIEIELPNSILSIGEYAFASCDYLSLINFAKAQFLISIADNALNNTKWLDSVIDDSIIINSIFYKYQGKMSTLTISNGITQIASKAFYKNESLTTVNIPQSVDYIGEEAFYDTNIYKINIFSSGSKLTSIGNHAFDSCEKLEYIDLQSTKKLSYIGDYAFSGTVMLSTFIIPSSVEILGEGVFYNSGIRSLIFVSNSKLISLPEKLCENNMGLYEVIFNGASALNTIETKAFLNCSNLKLFRNISARLLSIGDEAFLGCGNLVAIEANTSQLNYIGINAIDDRYVTSLNSNMRIIGGVLIKYNGDEKVVEIPNNIFTIYDGAFEGKTALEEIIFPENSVIQRINNDAFANCTNLVNINFPDTISKVGDNVMLGTKWLDNQMRDENNDFIHISNSLIKYKGSEKRIVIPNYITVINSNAFDGIEFYNITIGSQLVEISENAFAGVIRPTVAYKLDETNDIVLADETDVNWNVILLSDNLSSNPIEVGENDNIPTIYVNSAKIKEDFYLDARWEAFDKTIKIAQYFKINYVIDVEKAIAMKLINDFMIYKEIEPEMLEGFLFAGWFLDAEYTKPLSYPLIISHDISIYAKFVSKSIGTEGGVFHFGSGEEINDIIKYIGDTDVTVVCPTTIATVDLLALTGKWKLAEGDEIATHKLNGDVYEVPIDSNDATHLYKGAFEDHNEIFKFYFADNSKITTIGKYAFRNCKSLKTIVLPSTIIAIDEYAFEGCTSLENIIFTNGEGTVTIGFGAFKDCTSLKSIILPNKVVLGDDVFEGCTSLVDVYSNTTEFADVQTLGGEITPFATSENLRIHVYASVYNFYYERWSVYKDNLVEVLDEEE